MLDRKAYDAERYRKHKHRLLAAQKVRHRKNPEKRNSYGRAWYAANRDERRAEIDSYRRKNLWRWQKYKAKYKARKLAATVGNVDKIYKRCAWWSQWFKVSVDHIIPLSKGGTHSPDNLQIIYASDNYKKHAKLDYKPRVVFL